MKHLAAMLELQVHGRLKQWQRQELTVQEHILSGNINVAQLK